MKMLWINPVGTSLFDPAVAELLQKSARQGTVVDVVSLPEDRPKHLEYHAYEGLVIGDIVSITRARSRDYDAIVIGCFYDPGLREAREVSGRAVVVAPCQASLVYVSHLANAFSVIVGRKKWIPKMEENVHMYGYGRHLRSMRPVELGVYDFQKDREFTARRLMEEGKRAVEEDLAEALILGCTIEFGFHEKMQDKLGVPVVDAILAPFKLAELLAETAHAFGWLPSRAGGGETPPDQEVREMGLFQGKDPVHNIIRGR